MPQRTEAQRVQQRDAQSTPAPRDESDAGPPRALLLDSDLFFAVKVTETLKHAGYTTRTVRRADDFAPALANEHPALALVNAGARGLDWRAAVELAHAAGIPVVVYAPHVDVETHEAARAAGATSVIANSKLAADLPGVVARALRRGSMTVETTTAPRDTTVAARDEVSDGGG